MKLFNSTKCSCLIVLIFLQGCTHTKVTNKNYQIYYVAGTKLSENLLTSLSKEKLKHAILLKNVTGNDNWKEEAVLMGKNCQLPEHTLLNSYPLLVAEKKCIVGDINIIEFVKKHNVL